jgi:hypothetical protein
MRSLLSSRRVRYSGASRAIGIGLIVFTAVLLLSPGPVGAAPPPLTPDAIQNAVYKPFGLSGPSRAVQLHNGTYAENLGDPINGLEVHVGPLWTTGDFNGDGAQDLAIIMIEDGYTGNNFADILSVYLNIDGVPTHVASAGVGGRLTNLKSLTYRSGSFILSGLVVGPGDANCCPSQPFTRTYTMGTDSMVDVSGIGSDAPGVPVPATDSTTATTPDGSDQAQPADEAPTAEPATDTSDGDTARDAILAAIDRANAAWTRATQSLDASVLAGNVAGQELINDQAELSRLRGLGQRRHNVNTSFAVIDVSLSSPAVAVVHTHEVWYAEISDATGRLLQRTAAQTYDETYVVEQQGGSWIVTRNDV